MKERDFWNLFKRNISFDMMVRLETSTMSGLPDVLIQNKGRTMFVELKIARGNQIKFTKYQPAFIHNYRRAGGVVGIVVRKDDTIKVWNGEYIDEVRHNGWNCPHTCMVSSIPFNWGEIKRSLLNMG